MHSEEVSRKTGRIRSFNGREHLTDSHLFLSNRDKSLMSHKITSPVLVIHSMRSLDDAIDVVNSGYAFPQCRPQTGLESR